MTNDGGPPTAMPTKTKVSANINRYLDLHSESAAKFNMHIHAETDKS